MGKKSFVQHEVPFLDIFNIILQIIIIHHHILFPFVKLLIKKLLYTAFLNVGNYLNSQICK